LRQFVSILQEFGEEAPLYKTQLKKVNDEIQGLYRKYSGIPPG